MADFLLIIRNGVLEKILVAENSPGVSLSFDPVKKDPRATDYYKKQQMI